MAFVATRLALDSFSPAQLTALRFLVAAVPALVLARPPLAWSTLVAIGLTLYTGQFLLQFFAIANGVPPGLASLLVQTQALFTILFAAMVLRETPTPRQLSGVALAFAGLVLIVLTVGHDLTGVGFGLAMGSAISWGVGNVLLKRIRDVEMLDLVVWMSLVPPLPALALSLTIDGPTALVRSVASASWTGVASVLYLGLVATILAYAIWGQLLRRYPAATVTPFALLVPFVGASSSALVFGERFGALRLAGMALVLLGIAVIVLSARASRRMAAGDDHTLSVVPATRTDAAGVVDLIGRVYAEYRFALGTDLVEELEAMCLNLVKEFRRPVVFAGQLVFQRENLFTRSLHHETAFSIQRRLQFAGVQVIILPIRVWERRNEPPGARAREVA